MKYPCVLLFKEGENILEDLDALFGRADSESGNIIAVLCYELFACGAVKRNNVAVGSAVAPCVKPCHAVSIIGFVGVFLGNGNKSVKRPLLVLDLLIKVQLGILERQHILVEHDGGGNDLLHYRHIADCKIYLVCNGKGVDCVLLPPGHRKVDIAAVFKLTQVVKLSRLSHC